MSSVSPQIAQLVIDWQRTHGRHALPWQRTRDPYRVWLSEIMLQQTQVSTVLGYYDRFLQRFPDVVQLAAAPLDDVLALWSGLGYYSRARNLHRCAMAVVAHHGGQFPRSSQALAQLPGIGRSTAAAIAAFCFGERAAILDGNVKRVLTRALGFGGDLAQPAQERALWAQADALLPEQGIESYTQGLMDLGAGVCLARRPQCFPVKTRKLKRGRRQNALLWLVSPDGGKLWLSQRPQTGVWAGLWSLPEFTDVDVLRSLAQSWPGETTALAPIHHVLTHFDWALQPLRHVLPATLSADLLCAIEAALPAGRWVTQEETFQLGLAAPVRKLLLSEQVQMALPQPAAFVAERAGDADAQADRQRTFN